MVTITTRRGRKVEIISQHELRDPLTAGEYVRAYCHIHGSDHQRSLSINQATGWGHCFNASCQATVVVAEWNPAVAAYLLHTDEQEAYSSPPLTRPAQEKLPLALQPVLLHAPKTTPKWQQDELNALMSLEERMQAEVVHAPLVQRYIEERGLPIEIALSTGVGCLPREMLYLLPDRRQQRSLRRWTGRIVFPLVTPGGKGYIGRTLWHWRPGMDENAHKALLDHRRKPRRWIKTNPAGWFSSPLEQLSDSIILVEGAFDRLTLLAAGFASTAVVALTGTAAQVDWFPPQVKTIVLAFDGDEGGKEATSRLADQLRCEGFNVRVCPPPCDKWGKDWNERWRKIGQESMLPLQEMYSELSLA